MQMQKENNDLPLTSTNVVEEELTKQTGVKAEDIEVETVLPKIQGVEEIVEAESKENKPQQLKRRQSEISLSSPVVKALIPNSVSLPQLNEAVVETQTSTETAGKTSLTRIIKNEESKEEELDLSNPHNLLLSFLRAEGYQAKTRKSVSLSDFFLELTSEHIEAYNTEIVKAVRERNIALLRTMHESGKTLQCSNRFGESLVHMACRRGYTDVVRFLVKEADVSLRVKDDFGRTPLHDACWSASPNFDLMDLIIEHDPDLLLIEDVRGHSPFSYARQSHWKDWSDFLTLKRGSLRLNTFTD